jgi:hypothetical protein
METNMTAAIVDAQGPGIADRIKTCARAICAEEGATWRMTAHDCGSWRAWGGARRPQGSMGPASVSGMTTPTSISPRVTGKGGDDSFNLIWSRHSADRAHGIDALPSRAELNWRWSRCGFLQLPQVRIIPLVVENESCRQFGTMKMPRARGARGRKFSMVPRQGRDRASDPGPAAYSAATE